MSHIEEYLKEKYKSLLPLDKKVPHRTFLVYNTWTNEVMVEKRVEKSKKSIYQKLQQVCSPHLAQIEEIVELDNECRIFELYISGESLKTKLERGVLTPQEVRKYSCMLLDLLEELQKKNIVHKDINPSNIIISTDGILKLIDFGIARSYQQEKTADTVIMGTVGYAAPEQFGFSQTNERTDMYAFGILINVMLTGKLPTEYLVELEPFRGIVMTCTQIDYRNRYESYAQIKKQLVEDSKIRNNGSSLNNKKGYGIREIPGFRSGIWWKEILAVIGYFFGFAFLISVDSTYITLPDFRQKVQGVLLASIAIIAPYFCILDPFHWFQRWLDDCKKWERYFIRICIATVVFVIGICFAPRLPRQ